MKLLVFLGSATTRQEGEEMETFNASVRHTEDGAAGTDRKSRAALRILSAADVNKDRSISRPEAVHFLKDPSNAFLTSLLSNFDHYDKDDSEGLEVFEIDDLLMHV